MNKKDWIDVLEDYELIFINEKVDNEKTIDTVAEIFSLLPTLDWDFEDPIGDLMSTDDGYILYIKAYSIKQAESWAKKLVKAGYKADAAIELNVPGLRVFDVDVKENK